MFEAQNPDFEKRVRDSFARQRIMQTIGASLGRVDAGEVEISLPYRDDLTQQHGFVHAGIVAAILDSACGYAAFTLMPADASVLSVEFKINLLSPASGSELLARGRVARPGRTITVCSGEVFARDGDGERIVAKMLCTMMAIFDRDDIRG